jgi:hypothetical protein
MTRYYRHDLPAGARMIGDCGAWSYKDEPTPFLWLAGFGLTYLPGQILGKAWMTALAVGLVALWRRREARHAP